MTRQKPKDYLLAEVGYNAFYSNTPQVFFDDLGHAYQMRWVNAVREITKLNGRTARDRKFKDMTQEEKRAYWRAEKERNKKASTPEL